MLHNWNGWSKDETEIKTKEKLESGIISRKKKYSWGENPERYIPGRCTITITICDSDDALNYILRKCTGG